MGCFCLNGYISRLPIMEGDSCFGILGIFDKKFLTFENYGETLSPIIPIALPIFGEYDGYGSLENIKYDKNIEIIEKFFNKPIKELLKDDINNKTAYELIGYGKENNYECVITLIIEHSFIYNEIKNIGSFPSIDFDASYNISMQVFNEYTKVSNNEYFNPNEILEPTIITDSLGKKTYFIDANTCFHRLCGETDFKHRKLLIHPYFYGLIGMHDTIYDLYLYRNIQLSNIAMTLLKEEYLSFYHFNLEAKHLGMMYLPNTSSSQNGMEDTIKLQSLYGKIYSFVIDRLK